MAALRAISGCLSRTAVKARCRARLPKTDIPRNAPAITRLQIQRISNERLASKSVLTHAARSTKNVTSQGLATHANRSARVSDERLQINVIARLMLNISVAISGLSTI